MGTKDDVGGLITGAAKWAKKQEAQKNTDPASRRKQQQAALRNIEDGDGTWQDFRTLLGDERIAKITGMSIDDVLARTSTPEQFRQQLNMASGVQVEKTDLPRGDRKKPWRTSVPERTVLDDPANQGIVQQAVDEFENVPQAPAVDPHYVDPQKHAGGEGYRNAALEETYQRPTSIEYGNLYDNYPGPIRDQLYLLRGRKEEIESDLYGFQQRGETGDNVRSYQRKKSQLAKIEAEIEKVFEKHGRPENIIKKSDVEAGRVSAPRGSAPEPAPQSPPSQSGEKTLYELQQEADARASQPFVEDHVADAVPDPVNYPDTIVSDQKGGAYDDFGNGEFSGPTQEATRPIYPGEDTPIKPTKGFPEDIAADSAAAPKTRRRHVRKGDLYTGPNVPFVKADMTDFGGRTHVSEGLGVSIGTVDNWLTNGFIPADALEKMKGFEHKTRPTGGGPVPGPTVPYTDEIESLVTRKGGANLNIENGTIKNSSGFYDGKKKGKMSLDNYNKLLAAPDQAAPLKQNGKPPRPTVPYTDEIGRLVTRKGGISLLVKNGTFDSRSDFYKGKKKGTITEANYNRLLAAPDQAAPRKEAPGKGRRNREDPQ